MPRNFRLLANLIAVSICMASHILPCAADTFAAKVIRVRDGDTIVIDHDGKSEDVRLNGIDCPECRQRFGTDATIFTSKACLDKIVELQTFNLDKYGRTIADVKLPDGSLLNEQLISAGFAWWYRQYAPGNKNLQQLEETAREKHLGLWSETEPMPPWEYRHPELRTKRPLEGHLAQLEAGAAETTLQPRLQSQARPVEEPNARTLQGQVQGAAPLQGGVEKVDSNLQASHPAYDQISSHSMLQGNANGSATIMRIVQTKFSPLAPETAAPATSRPLPPETNGIPLRAGVSDSAPPSRDPAYIKPAATHDVFSPPSHYELSEPPRRSQGNFDQPPVRDRGYGTAPVRVAVGDTPPPPRTISMAPPPPLYIPPQQNYYAPPPTSEENSTSQHEQRRERLKHKPSEAIDSRQRTKNTQVQLNTPPKQLPSAAEEALLWDAWYKHVNELVCSALTRTMPANGNPAGHNLIKVTVWANHKIQVVIVQPSNRDFDKAITDAYRSLNLSPELAFPAGTQRAVVDYETAHIQDVPAPTAGFDSRTIHNDVEILK